MPSTRCRPSVRSGGRGRRGTLDSTVPREVDRDEVRRLLDAGAQLVEVLPSSEYDEDHLPGALNLPLSRVDAEAGDVLDRARAVVVYCWDTA